MFLFRNIGKLSERHVKDIRDLLFGETSVVSKIL